MNENFLYDDVWKFLCDYDFTSGNYVLKFESYEGVITMILVFPDTLAKSIFSEDKKYYMDNWSIANMIAEYLNELFK